MKICYLNHDTQDNTGAGRFYRNFSEALKKIVPDWQIEVLTSGHVLPSNKIKLLLHLPAIRKIIKSCDFIHALDSWPYGVIAALVNRSLKMPFIITAIGTGAIQPLYSWWRRPILKWAYRQADKVIAASNNTKREIQKFLPDLEIEVVSHGVDVDKFSILNFQFSLPVKKPYILSVGTLKKRKGFEYSIKAFAEISLKFPDLKYVIVGNGPESENLKFKIKNLKLENRVIFLDKLPEEELIALYKNAALFILLPQDVNKDIEGFGLVFLEAAAAGLPVVATKETSAEDAVRDGRNGILVPPRDFKAAASAMEKILSDKKFLENMSQESVKFAKEMTWEKVANAYLSEYVKL